MGEGTHKAPNIPPSQFKRTKIIATIGPASNSYESILGMLMAGANAFRLNFSHGTHEERTQQIEWIRKASREYGKPVAIIQDLQGPKIRLGDFDGVITVQPGQELRFRYQADYEREGIIPMQYDLAKKVKRGERLLIYDGKVKTEVVSAAGGIVHVRAENEGILTKRKGINLPDTDLEGDILTKKDREDIAYGAEQDIDYIALSFVQTDKDIGRLRTILKNHNSSAKIIAKVETKAAVENIVDIVKASDAVMVARGDLAIETLAESVPLVTRNIVNLCREYSRISIVATQMLASMTNEPEPTRAEVSDVANAVLAGADTLMLSDETANGRYPIDSIKVMKRVILYTQANSPLTPVFFRESDRSQQSAIASAVITLAHQVGAKTIVAETKSGATPLAIAAHRPTMPIIVVTPTKRVAQQLSILYASKTYLRPQSRQAAQKLTDWLRLQKVFARGDIVVTASGKYNTIGGTDTIKVRVLE